MWQKISWQGVIVGLIFFMLFLNTSNVRSQEILPPTVPNSTFILPPEDTEDQIVSQVREYFMSRWQSDPNFADYLEYRLVLGTDGRVRSLKGVGVLSERYLKITKFLKLGSRLVARSSREHTVWVILDGNGNVRVSLAPGAQNS